ncbi:spindle pole body protein Sfi1 [Chytridiales sp. JEL 0842]|nr:spindle pole body protein Sfi1 [Chytridiales sp. JEL 0842]
MSQLKRTNSDLSNVSEVDPYENADAHQQLEPLESFPICQIGVVGHNIWNSEEPVPIEDDKPTKAMASWDSKMGQQAAPATTAHESPSQTTTAPPIPAVVSRIPIPTQQRNSQVDLSVESSIPEAPSKQSIEAKNSQPSLNQPSSLKHQQLLHLLATKYTKKWREYVRSRKLQRIGAKILARKVLLVWKEVSGTAWRSQVRAEVHNKFRLCSMTWRAWRSFVYISRLEKEEAAKIEAMGSRVKERRALYAWIKYHNEKRLKRLRKDVAQIKRDTFLVKRFYHIWFDHLTVRQKRKEQMEMACQIALETAYRLAFSTWCERLKYTRAIQAKISKHISKTNERMKRGVLRALTAYTEQRKTKSNSKELADVTYRRSIVRRSIRRWTFQTVRTQIGKDADLIATRMDHRKRLIWGMRTWRTKLWERIHERDTLSKAGALYKHLLKQRALRRLNQTSIKANSSMKLMAKFFVRWRVSSDQSAKAKEAAKLLPGILFRNQKLLNAYWKKWTGRISNMKLIKLNMDVAERFHRLCSIKRSFLIMRYSAALRKEHHRLSAIGERFYCRGILTKYLLAWMFAYADVTNEKVQMKKAERFHDRLLLRRAFHAFSLNADVEAREREAELTASIHYYRSICLKAIRGWRLITQVANEQALNQKLAIRIRYNSLLRTFFSRWQKQLNGRRWDSVSWRLAALHYQRMLVRKAILGWKEYVMSLNSFKLSILQFVMKIERACINRAFSHWKKKAVVAKEVRVMLEEAHEQWAKEFGSKKISHIADRFRRKSLLSIYLHSWHSQNPNWHATYTRRNVKPLIHWGTTLTSKVFHAWIIYKANKQEKKRRLKEAEGWRREMALRHGAVAWLQVGDSMKMERESKVLEVGAKMFSEELKLAHKYVKRWRAKAMGGRARRLGREGENSLPFSLSFVLS